MTGAASGIGRATVSALTDQGWEVIAVDRDEVGLSTITASSSPGRVVSHVVDVGDEHQRTALVDSVGPLDALVNAAGVISLADLREVTVEDWRRVQRINAEAPFFLMQGVADHLRVGGSVVNLASTAGKTGTTLEAAPYAASKAALMSLTRAFANLLAPRGITVNAVCPGVIDTPMQDTVKAGIAAVRGTTVDEIERARAVTVPLGRAGTATEVAQLIRWLLSSESRYITGQSINICGGLVTW